ncbi:MAG: D-serine ammonia-lyase [Paenisporosarcina sp.]
MVFEKKELNKWFKDYPLLKKIVDLEPVVWLNPKHLPKSQLGSLPVTREDMDEAAALWDRFAPFLALAFPETRETNGIVESPLRLIDTLRNELNNRYVVQIEGDLFLKCDNELPIAGSIKARGGVYEVLYYAEKLALEAGLVHKDDDYSVFLSEKFTSFFQQFTIGVGSTGNLGLSIGIIAAKLGFNVSVYMSYDAKQWKKDLLRAKGANVHEFAGDFGEAIFAGREHTKLNPKGYFVDDENSRHLFLGYSVAAIRLEEQLAVEKVKVDEEHPLFVYLPCGVGGSPGGIAFGLRQVFGDHVHCFFVEPTHSPAVLIGLLTGEKEKVSVQDFGIDNVTEGDGLAVGRPSSFASSISEKTISGMYTLEDDELFKLLALLADSEGILIEPSAASGLLGPIKILATDYLNKHQLNAKQATHIVWATGGLLVPREDMDLYYEKGIELMSKLL